MAMSLRSSAFQAMGSIPTQYTCEGPDLSPPLAWEGVPPAAKSLALIVDDPDAPDPRAPKMVYVHWVLWNVPPTEKGLAEAAATKGLPKGTHVGTNDWKKVAWGGPCPPIGRHRYFFKLYALDTMLDGLKAATKPDLEKEMKGHVLAQAELVGTYQKTKK